MVLEHPISLASYARLYTKTIDPAEHTALVFETPNFSVFLLIRADGGVAYDVRCANCDVISLNIEHPLAKIPGYAPGASVKG